jgi:Uma2 family endonuclease
MSLPELRHPGYTIEDWKSWEGRWELIHGVPYDMTPAPSLDHQRISGQLFAGIFHALEVAKRQPDGGGCEVFAAPIDVYLPNQESVYQPDLVIVCDQASLIDARGIFGVPSLICEIISPSTVRRDLWTKRQSYEAAGVPEYLIVDPDERMGLLLRLAGGRYQEAASLPWGSMVAALGGKLTFRLGPPTGQA